MRRVLIILLLFLVGCSNVGISPVTPPDNDLKMVGDVYEDQGSGEIRESASDFSNQYFDVHTEYRNYRYLLNGVLPVYYHGDDVIIDITIDYKQGTALDDIPQIFTRGWIQHRNARNGALLPGNSVQVTNLLFSPYGHRNITCGYHIYPGVPQEDPYTAVSPSLNLQLIWRGGTFTMNLISGGAGIWILKDP